MARARRHDRLVLNAYHATLTLWVATLFHTRSGDDAQDAWVRAAAATTDGPGPMDLVDIIDARPPDGVTCG